MIDKQPDRISIKIGDSRVMIYEGRIEISAGKLTFSTDPKSTKRSG